ncbi:MAG: ATP-binding cassette domain-containing protein [Tissierellia bacterium]|nr:ATP-binding cassette domain-containing protein [Tissierellia bacterium]
MSIKFQKLYKSYGDTEILHGVSFEVTSGKPMAFLGRNGAGKTTTIRGFMDVFRFDLGSITINDKPFKLEDFRVGYLPEERGLYQKHKILEQLIYFSKLRGIDGEIAKKNILELLDKVELLEYADKKLETLSKGNQQKVQIVQALMNNPEIVILDEPFSGLDPVNSKILRDLVKDITDEGNYLIFSSHQMGYVEEMCEELTIIEKGNIVVSDSIANIKKEMGGGRVTLSAEKMDLDSLEMYLRSQISNLELSRAEDSLVINLNDRNKNSFLQELLDIGLDIKYFGEYEPSVYDIFINSVGEHHE